MASPTTQVFFMIGCQRSGSNWLRTMLSEREDLIAPHPPHIMRDFMPRLEKYGDLSKQTNLKILIDHVCAFVENNQVPWLDLHSHPMKFKRDAILMEVMISIVCFEFKEKYTSMQNGNEIKEAVENSYYLLAVFDAIMNTMTKANRKKIWMCKSMGMSQFHDILLSFYGNERLRYVYLVRDPRDVCLSFMKTPVGDCHPYAIVTKWCKLQNLAMHILHNDPDLIHQVCYEEVLGDKKHQVAKIIKFMGARDVCRSMRRGSVVVIKSENEVVSEAKKGREALMARGLSYQFKNLARGDSFTKGQFKKWAKEMKEEDIRLVESIAFNEMKRLGYEQHLIHNEEDRIDFTEELIHEYTVENEKLIAKMNADLAVENPADLERRKIQAAVLERTTSEHYDEEFIKSTSIKNIDWALDNIDYVQLKGIKRMSSADFEFCKWPMNASFVGFQKNEEVADRFKLHHTQILKIDGGICITFAAASQAGYYPTDKNKPNQDAFIGGEVVSEKANHTSGVLFAVFDGHGPNGHDCAFSAVETVKSLFVREMRNISTRKMEICDRSIHTRDLLSTSYHQASMELVNGDIGIDASQSGTTATSLFVTKDFLHVANVGDSRCLLVEHINEGNDTIVKQLTQDHTPDQDSEIKRIEAHGGVVMTSDQYDTNNDPNSINFQQKRIWSKDGKGPGTAFTRSIGDSMAKELGVIADPECEHFPIPSAGAAFVLGSDGVFDFVPNDEIGAVVKKYEDPADACRELVGKAFNRWCANEERTDDITVIVGHIHVKGKMKSRERLGLLLKKATKKGFGKKELM